MQSDVNVTKQTAGSRDRAGAARHRAGRPRDAAATRACLVAAAGEIFNRDGYHATDSNRIARAAGYAPASFYKHFRDKREVFLAAYSRWVATEWEEIRREWLRAASRVSAPRRIVRRVLEHHRRWAGFRRSLRALADTDDVVRDFRNAQRHAQLTFLRRLTGARTSARGRSDDLFTLLAFERVCDALADGEAAALGASEERLASRLAGLLTARPAT
jgi:AcrR family transcriptional regulator